MANGRICMTASRAALAAAVLMLLASGAQLALTVRATRMLRSLIAERTELVCDEVGELGAEVERRLDDLERGMDGKLLAATEGITGISRTVGALRGESRQQEAEARKLREAYEALRAEERNARIETAALDATIAQQMQEADALYEAGEYAAAYRLYDGALAFHSGNLAVRAGRVKALFNMNRADSAVYDEVRAELLVLERNGVVDGELDEIAAFMEVEMGGRVQDE